MTVHWERGSTPQIVVYVDTSDEAMMGSQKWGQYDPIASKKAFLTLIREDVLNEYPAVIISVVSGPVQKVDVSFALEGQHTVIEERIHDIIETVYLDAEWPVLAEPPSAALF